ncbi:hypothetical protein BaRGS_00024497, partial [Batillaria attramentaria]
VNARPNDSFHMAAAFSDDEVIDKVTSSDSHAASDDIIETMTSPASNPKKQCKTSCCCPKR